MVRPCYLCSKRKSASLTKTLHSFPKKQASRSLWIEFCGLNEETDDVSRLFLCSAHFSMNAYLEPRAKELGSILMLRPGAVPTIKYPKKSVASRSNLISEAVAGTSLVSQVPPVVSEEEQIPKKKRLCFDPRYVGQITVSDILNPTQAKQVLSMAKSRFSSQAAKIKSLQQKNRRLVQKMQTLQNLVPPVKKKTLKTVCEKSLMKIEKERNPTSLCRGCLENKPPMKRLFDNTKKSKALKIQFAEFLNLEVKPYENYPLYICNMCEKKIDSSLEFKAQCLGAQQALDYYFQTDLTKDIENTEIDYNDQNIKIENDGADNENDSNEQIACTEEKEEETITIINHDLDVKDESIDVEEVEIKQPDVVNTNKKRRLEQYTAVEVEKAIRKVRDRLYGQVTCMFCNFQATSNRTLSLHVSRTHRDEKPKWCSVCNGLFESLDEHNLKVHCDDLKCEFCGKNHSTMGNFMDHMAAHGDEQIHLCPVCKRAFTSLKLLKKHEISHIEDRPFECHICKKRFLLPTILRTHLRKIHNSIIKSHNSCKKCGKTVRNMERHDMRFHSSNPVADKCLCPYCGKWFRKSRWSIHIRTHTGEAPYQCQYCEKKLKTRPSLITHERTHTGEKPYLCTACGKGFAQSSALKTHMSLHLGKQEQCNICEKRFSRPAELRVHLRKHTGEIPYNCEYCDRGFKQKSHLADHLRTHSDDRPHKCEYCDKSFKDMGTYRGHMLIHNGDKPYKCSQCTYACRKAYVLTQHMLIHDKDRPQPDQPHCCGVCEKRFSTNENLSSHYNLYHSDLDISNFTQEQTEEEEIPDTVQLLEGPDKVEIEILPPYDLPGESKFDDMFFTSQ